MRIEKYVHSCLILSDGGQRLLFDPGKFSFVDGRVDPAQLSGADHILFTHGHPDHVDLKALNSIVGERDIPMFGTKNVVAKLREAGLNAEVFESGKRELGPFAVEALKVRHEPILADEIPEIAAFVVNDRFLNPGDSFDKALHRLAGIEILALPVMAPFLTEIAVYKFAKTMRSRHIIPVHDGYARDYFLSQRYDTYAPYLEEAGMILHRIETPGDGVDL